MVTIIILIIVAVLVIGLIVIYNSLVTLNIRANEAWSDITVQLKRRADLIPNLINTVKGYATHEKTVFDDVTKARAETIDAKTPVEAAKAEGDFQRTMKSLFAVAEAYPDLKASENFKELQAELTDTEDKIQAARRFYNGVVRDFNTRRTIFPINVVAGVLGFKQDKEFFEVDEAENATIQQPVDVKF